MLHQNNQRQSPQLQPADGGNGAPTFPVRRDSNPELRSALGLNTQQIREEEAAQKRTSLSSPLKAAPPTSAPLSPATPRFAENFWGEGDRGLDVLVNRMKGAKHTCEDVVAWFSTMASIEEDYSRKMLKLCRVPVGKDETGTMKESLETIRMEMETQSKLHSDLANEMRTSLEKPLSDFLTSQVSTRRNFQSLAEKSLKNKIFQTMNVQKAKEKYETRCVELNALMSSSRVGMPPSALDKIRGKIEKAQFAVKQADQEYQRSVESLHEAVNKWDSDFEQACNQFQLLEESRIDYLRTLFWNYANLFSGSCVAIDESCERVRQSLEKCEVSTDIGIVVASLGTGKSRPKPLAYTNYFNNGPLSSQMQSPATQMAADISTTRPLSYLNTPPAVAPMQSPSQQPIDMRMQQMSLNNNPMMYQQQQQLPQQQQQQQMYQQVPPQQVLQSPPLQPSGSPPRQPQIIYTTQAPQGQHYYAQGPPVTSQPPQQQYMQPVMMQQGYQAQAQAQYQGSPQLRSQQLQQPQHQQQPVSPQEALEYNIWDVPEGLVPLFQVQVLFDYQAQAPEELSIRAGEIIPVLATQDDGWWEGARPEPAANGRKRKGLFPSNFVEILR